MDARRRRARASSALRDVEDQPARDEERERDRDHDGERSSAAALSSEAEGAPIARAVPVRDPYRSRDGAGRVASRSMICGRGTDARRPASTERRGRERMRCFFATGG